MTRGPVNDDSRREAMGHMDRLLPSNSAVNAPAVQDRGGIRSGETKSRPSGSNRRPSLYKFVTLMW